VFLLLFICSTFAYSWWYSPYLLNPLQIFAQCFACLQIFPMILRISIFNEIQFFPLLFVIF
jgi:hypothetical protein